MTTEGTLRPLYKTTIVIWTDYDPVELNLEELAREADSGDGYCSSTRTDLIQEPTADHDWDGTEFFSTEEEG